MNVPAKNQTAKPKPKPKRGSRARRPRPWAVLILLAAVVACLGTRLAVIETVVILDHDDAISYLAATGHQGEYERLVREAAPPYGVWAEAQQWKRFLEVDHAFCFKTIGADLAEADIHPPLYFWLLHVWVLITGVTLWSGPALNLILALGTLWALYGLTRHLFRDSMSGAVVALFWGLSPAAFPIAVAVRQYELLALISVLFIWQTIRMWRKPEPPSRGSWARWALLLALGMLTQYYFALLFIGCLLLLLHAWRKEARDKLVPGAVATVAGLLVVVVLHPGTLGSLAGGWRRGEGVETVSLGERLDMVMSRYASFFVELDAIPDVPTGILGGAILLVALAGIAWRGLDNAAPRDQGRGVEVRGVGFLCLWLIGCSTVLFLLSVSPAHAMETRYQSMVWPLFAIVPVWFARSFRAQGSLITWGLLVLMVIGSVHGIVQYRSKSAEVFTHWDRITGQEQILLDSAKRGVLLPLMWVVPGHTRVYAADSSTMVQEPGVWVSGLRDGDYWISTSRTSRADRERIRAVLGKRFQLPHANSPMVLVLREKS